MVSCLANLLQQSLEQYILSLLSCLLSVPSSSWGLLSVSGKLAG